MLKKIILSVIIFSGIFLLGNSCFAGSDVDNINVVNNGGSILKIPFSSGDVNLTETFSREQNVSMDTRGDGADRIQLGIMRIVEVLVKFMGFFAFIYLFYTGISIVIKGDGDELAGAKTKILWTIFALLMTFLIEPLIRTVFFGGSGSQKSGDILSNSDTAVNAAKIGVLQIEGLIGYIETFVILLALVMMIKSAIQMIFAHDEAFKLEEQKKTILWTGIGLIIILLSKVLVYFGIYGNGATGEGRDMGKVVSEVSGVINYLLGFLASIAVAMIIYGGTKMIFSGDQEAEEGKVIIKNVIIGAIIISVAYVLVVTLVGGEVR